MEVELTKIEDKPTDFKTCKDCGYVNWYENEECVKCGHKTFNDDNKKVLQFVSDEYQFYEESEGYTELEIGRILYEV